MKGYLLAGLVYLLVLSTARAVCVGNDIYGHEVVCGGSWHGSYPCTNLYDGNLAVAGQPTGSAQSSANFSSLIPGKNYNILVTMDTAGSYVTYYLNRTSGSWANHTYNITAPKYYDILDQNGTLRLYATESTATDYNEHYVNAYCYDPLESDDDYLVIRVFNEEDMSSQLLFNMSLQNGTGSSSYDNLFNFVDYKGTALTGSVTFELESDGYGDRTIIQAVSEADLENKTFLMLPTGSGATINYVVVDVIDQPLVSATVKSFRTIDGVTYLIEEDQTDSSGGVSMFQEPTATYIIEVSKDGYLARNYTITPTNSPYTLHLYTTDYEDLSWLFEYVYYKFEPQSLIDGNNTFQYYLYSFNNSLEYWEFNVSYNGTVLDSKYNDTLAGGGVMNTTVDLTGYIGNVTLTGRFKLQNFTEYTPAKYYYFLDWQNATYVTSNYTLNKTLELIGENVTDEESKFGLGIIMLLATIGVGGVVTSIEGPGSMEYSSIAMLLVLAFFTFIFIKLSIFSWTYFILTAVGVVSMMVARSVI